MDINSLYTQHQLGVMRASDAGAGSLRSLHLASAHQAADDIATYQLSQGAPAAAGWLRVMAEADRLAASRQRPAR